MTLGIFVRVSPRDAALVGGSGMAMEENGAIKCRLSDEMLRYQQKHAIRRNTTMKYTL